MIQEVKIMKGRELYFENNKIDRNQMMLEEVLAKGKIVVIEYVKEQISEHAAVARQQKTA